jgi:hypothetical protein
MGLITRIDDDTDRMQPDNKITSGGLAFVADRLRTLHLQDPSYTCRRTNHLPSVRSLPLAGLEGAMEVVI